MAGEGQTAGGIDTAREKPAIDAVMAALETPAPSSPAAEAPAATASQAPSSPASPATPAPQAPASPEAAPAAGGSQTLTPEQMFERLTKLEKQNTDKDTFIKQLESEARERGQRLQEMLEQSTQTTTSVLQKMDEQLKRQQPQMSKEEREAQLLSELQKINDDPKGYVDARVNEAVKALEDKISGMTQRVDGLDSSTATVRQQAIADQQLSRLADNGFAEEVKSPEFREAMRSRDNITKVYMTHFRGQDAAQLFTSPTFWSMCAMQAKLDAKATFAPQQQQSEADKSHQAAVATSVAGNNQVPGNAGPPSASAGKKSSADSFRDAVVGNEGSGMRTALDKAFGR